MEYKKDLRSILDERNKVVQKLKNKKKQKTEKNTFQKIIIKKFGVERKNIDIESYEGTGNRSKRYSIFSSLSILNRNSDLYYYTKNRVATILKTIYTAEELKDLIEETNSLSFDGLVKKVESAMKGSKTSIKLSETSSEVIKFISQIKNNETIDFKDGTENDENLNPTFRKYENGPGALVYQVSNVYGDNRYFGRYNSYTKIMTPLFVKFDSEKEGAKKLTEVEKYLNSTYGYKFIYSNVARTNKLTKTIKVNKYTSKMDNTVNLIYSVAKNLKGCKNITLNLAKKVINSGENNEFLDSRKFAIVSNKQKVKKIFKAHSDTISDVVATLTTIFMARFVFDSKYFAEIERDLTEQACAKMKELAFNKDPNEDYFINQLIEERLRINIAQVCAANNITNANDLLEIYNKNGTVIVNANKIASIDELVFSLQYSVNEKVKNKKLTNLPEPVVVTEKQVKNKAIKYRPYHPKKEKPNKILDEIRKTDEYKKYYEEYINQFKFALDKDNILKNAELDEIRESTEENINSLNRIASSDLTEEEKDTITSELAANDAVLDSIETEEKKDEKINEEVESENPTLSRAIPETEEPYQITMEDFGLNITPIEAIEKVDEIVETESQEESEEFTQLSIFDAEEVTQSEEEKPRTIFLTEKGAKKITDEELENKIKKHLTKLIHGSNGKVGVVGSHLNYRIIEKKVKKNASINDSERLDDAELKKANKIRDEKITLIAESVSKKIVEFYRQNKDSLDEDIKVAKLCLLFIRKELNIDENKTFTNKNLKECLSVLITESVNPALKELNLELYTGKKTYKNYHGEVDNLILGEGN